MTTFKRIIYGMIVFVVYVLVFWIWVLIDDLLLFILWIDDYIIMGEKFHEFHNLGVCIT